MWMCTLLPPLFSGCSKIGMLKHLWVNNKGIMEFVEGDPRSGKPFVDLFLGGESKYKGGK